MSTNLPGNKFEEMAYAETDATWALVQANLAIAHELRTQTLLQANLHNRREAARIHGADFEGMPDDVREMIAKQGEQIDERLGGDL